LVDIPRKDFARKRRIKRIILSILGLAAVAAITYGLSRLEPAAPTVEMGTVFPDTVKRGPMLRSVRGLGTLVPESIIFIPAKREGRVMRRLLLPGSEVQPETVLLELSSPQLEQEVFQVETQIKADAADLEAIRVRLETERLDQESVRAQVESEYEQAKAQLQADEQLAKAGLLDQLTLAKSRVTAQQLGIRLKLETERLEIREKSVEAQLATQRAKMEQGQALYELRRQELNDLRVRAGISGVLQQLEVEVGQLVTPGTVLARVSDPQRLKAALRIPETQVRDVLPGQHATVDTRNGIIPGTVMRVDPASIEGTVTVDVQLDGELPRGARPDLSVDGTIELERLDDVLFVGRPVYGQPQSTISLFKIQPDGEYAVRTQVELGSGSVNYFEIRGGLQEGDRVILSDMSAWDNYDRIRLNR
jgi:HlyD family secretion protein